MSLQSLLNTISKPQYTGERRCWPCTSVNLVGVTLLSVLVGILWLPGGVFVAIIGVGAVIFRGYFIPFTPRIAPRITKPFTRAFGRRLPPEQSPGSLGEGTSGNGEGVLRLLLDKGILREDERTDLYLDETFRDEWQAEAETLASTESSELTKAAAAAVPFEAEADTAYGNIVIKGKDEVIALEQPHAILEVAAVRTLESCDIPTELGVTAATPLRTFVKECPNCGDDVVETTQTDCCSDGQNDGRDVHNVLGCHNCGQVYYRFEDS